MGNKSITTISNIFIDTGIFIDLLKIDFSTSSEDVQKRIKQIHMFFSAIEAIDRKITFQTTSINIAELFHCEEKHEDSIKAMVSVLGSKDLEIISFDSDAAIFHNVKLEKFLGNTAIKEIKQAVGYPTSAVFANVEDRIRKDMLICSTALLYRSDLILTNDAGFKILCDKIGVSCHCFTGDESDFTMNIGGTKIVDFY